MIVIIDLLLHFRICKLEVFSFINEIKFRVKWSNSLGLFVNQICLDRRPNAISSVKHFHWLTLASTLETCLLTGRLVEIFNLCLRVLRVYGLI